MALKLGRKGKLSKGNVSIAILTAIALEVDKSPLEMWPPLPTVSNGLYLADYMFSGRIKELPADLQSEMYAYLSTVPNGIVFDKRVWKRFRNCHQEWLHAKGQEADLSHRKHIKRYLK